MCEMSVGRNLRFNSSERFITGHKALIVMIKSKLASNSSPCSPAHHLSFIAVQVAPTNRISESIDVSSGNNPALLAIHQTIRCAGHVGGYDGQSRRHRLQKLLSETFRNGREYEQIRFAITGGDLLR